MALLLVAALGTSARAEGKPCNIDNMLDNKQGRAAPVDYILTLCKAGDHVKMPFTLTHTIERVCDLDKGLYIDAEGLATCVVAARSPPGRRQVN